MKNSWLLLLPIVCAQDALSSISSSDLLKLNVGETSVVGQRETIVDALTKSGVLAITEVEGLAAARSAAFSAVQTCLKKSPSGKFMDQNGEPSLTRETLPDGSLRQSIGTQIKPGNEHLPLSAELLEECPELEDSLDTLRDIVNQASTQLMFALDDAFLSPTAAPDRKAPPLFYDRAFATSGGVEHLNTVIDGQARKYPGNYWSGFTESAQAATQLEHFHSYTPSRASPVAGNDDEKKMKKNSVDYHTDAGLFILFVPAWYSHDPLDLNPTVGDFKFLHQDGSERSIVVQSDASATKIDAANVDVVAPDTLIMMAGKGAEQYLSQSLRGRKMRAVPHAVSLAQQQQQGAVDGQQYTRNWYGRMFLPPSSAYFPEYKMTYGEIRAGMIATSRQAITAAAIGTGAGALQLPVSVGCGLSVPLGGSLPDPKSLKRALVSGAASESVPVVFKAQPARRSGAPIMPAEAYPTYPTYASLRSGIKVMDSCNAGYIWCWHQCDAIADYNLTCPSSEVTCVDSNGNPANPDDHVPSNQPGCVGVAPPDTGGFCQGMGSSMYMEGFISYVTGKYRTDGGDTTPGCIALWFPEWVLDTKGKFTAACFGVLLLGIFTEFLSYLRRQVRALLRGRRAPEQILVMCTLYALQLAVGYLCMLVAMTYQVELFVCVVVGLGAGHALFNFKPALSEPSSTSKTGYSDKDKDKGFRAATEGEDEVVDPCCQYLAMEEDSEHSTVSSTKGNTANPLR